MSETHDTIIIGGGPAGLTAALYAGRARMKAVLFERLVHGGQVATTQIVENYPGFAKPVKGPELIEAMVEQAKNYGCEFENGEVKEARLDGNVKVVVAGDREYRSRTLIIASGASPRTLGIPGETELKGRGVSYCATCDGPLYFGKTVAVIGGGDSACEEGHFLTKFVNKVYLIHRRDELRAVKALQELVLNNKKIEMLWDTVPLAVEGEGGVKKLKTKNVKSGEERELDVAGVFFYVGNTPSTSFLKMELEKDEAGFIKTNEEMQTSVPGVFAVGDVRSKVLRQIATAVGDAPIAVHMAGKYLLEHGEH
jgi:thioredoxin reductase (NADPH)